MWLIKVGSHAFRFDSIEYVLRRDAADGKGDDGGMTLYLRGRERGIELTPEESASFLGFLGRECVVTDLSAQGEPDACLPHPASEVAWYLAVSPLCRYDQDALLRPRLAAIRRHYPGARVMMQTAETPSETVARWRSATTDLDVDWLPPLPIHDSRSGITPIEAMLKSYLGAAEPAEFLIKVDLDARVWRRFRRLPRGTLGVFGTLEHAACSGFPYGDFPNVQGGCYGLSRETARNILGSGLLSGDDLRKNPGVWADGIADWEPFARGGMVLEDGLLRWAIKEMKMKPFGFDEISSHFRRRDLTFAGDFAVTHPHKFLEPDEGGRGRRMATRGFRAL